MQISQKERNWSFWPLRLSVWRDGVSASVSAAVFHHSMERPLSLLTFLQIRWSNAWKDLWYVCTNKHLQKSTLEWVAGFLVWKEGISQKKPLLFIPVCYDDWLQMMQKGQIQVVSSKISPCQLVTCFSFQNSHYIQFCRTALANGLHITFHNWFF